MSGDCIVVGAGGHAAVVIEAMRLEGRWRPTCALDPRRQGDSVVGVPVEWGEGVASRLLRSGVSHFVIGVGTTGDNGVRKRLFERYLELGFAPATVVDPVCRISPSAVLGAGTQALVGAIVQARARIGRNVVINTGSIVEHDCEIGDHAFVASGARLAGRVSVGAGAFVGLAASVIQEIRIGERARVGAGAIVLRDVQPEERALGVVRRSRPRREGSAPGISAR